MKHEWRKAEKEFYLPKKEPAFVEIPQFQFIAIDGAGNPNKPEFAQFIEALYSLAYPLKVTLKKAAPQPKDTQTSLCIHSKVCGT